MTTTHVKHPDHTHVHGDGCGHVAIPHGDHVDYIHDGHLHTAHDGHVDECITEVHIEHPRPRPHARRRLRACRRPPRRPRRLPPRRTPPRLSRGPLGRPLRRIDTTMVIAANSDGLPRRAPQERSTRQKRALAAVLEASDGFRSAQELHARAPGTRREHRPDHRLQPGPGARRRRRARRPAKRRRRNPLSPLRQRRPPPPPRLPPLRRRHRSRRTRSRTLGHRDGQARTATSTSPTPSRSSAPAPTAPDAGAVSDRCATLPTDADRRSNFSNSCCFLCHPQAWYDTTWRR